MTSRAMFATQVHTAETESSRVYEPLIGVVTDNKDPSKLGRVKVKIPILDKEQDSSCWAPIVMSGAGKNRGWFFIPETRGRGARAVRARRSQSPAGRRRAVERQGQAAADNNPGRNDAPDDQVARRARRSRSTTARTR